MKKIILPIYLLLFSTLAMADSTGQVLNKFSEIAAAYIGEIIPGEGVTETSLELRDDNDGDGELQFSILGVRDLSSKENSNLFTQFSLHTQEIESNTRMIGNLGVGYRTLSFDQTMMFGANAFYDQDIYKDHKRISLGLEAKASILDFNINHYRKATNQQIISGTKEQVLSGNEFNISSQVPYLPWTTVNYQGYQFDNEKASNDLKGSIYSLEMAITPSLVLNIERDNSSIAGVKDTNNYELVFIYPPKENKLTLTDGIKSDIAFEKRNMKASLKEKVRRNNNLTVEIQGAVIITRK